MVELLPEMRRGCCSCEVAIEDEGSSLFILVLRILSGLEQMNEACRQFDLPMSVRISTSKIGRDAAVARCRTMMLFILGAHAEPSFRGSIHICTSRGKAC